MTDVKPLDTDGITAIVTGIVLWAVAAVGCLVARGWLADSGREWWLWVCVSGVVTGFAGLAIALRRRERMRRTSA